MPPAAPRGPAGPGGEAVLYPSGIYVPGDPRRAVGPERGQAPGRGLGPGPAGYGRTPDPGYRNGPGPGPGSGPVPGPGPGHPVRDVYRPEQAPGYRRPDPRGPGYGQPGQGWRPPAYDRPAPPSARSVPPSARPTPVRPELIPPGVPYPASAPEGGYRPNGHQSPRGPVPGGPPRPTRPVNGPAPAGYHASAGYHGPPVPPRPVSYPAPQAPAPPAPVLSEPGTFVYRDTGEPDEPEDAGAAEPAGVYGPDDPAYGPPDPSWYHRQREEDEAARRQAEESQHMRGPFEPLSHVDGSGQAAPGYYAEAGHQGLDDEPPASTADEDQAIWASAAAPGEAALAQIKDLYMTAEAIGDENLGKHYQRLLERQRQLIGEYFKESGFGDYDAGEVSVSGESPR
jgi:hypothetical protein